MENKQKKITDVSINREYGIPIRTIQDWKNRDTVEWRYKAYLLFLDSMKQKNQILCGVYLLFRDKKIVYVGKSINIPRRIRQHEKDELKVFDDWYCESVEDDLSRDILEKEYIKKHNPEYNVHHIETIDTLITKEIGIPTSTLQDWKNGDGWRLKLYKLIKIWLAKE